MPAKKVVIIGGGIAGMGVAKTLREQAGDAFDITVITKDTFYMAGPSRPLILTGEQSYDRITRGYEEAAKNLKINLVNGLVTRIDPTERKVYLAESPTKPTVPSIEYDYLIVAPGVVLDGTSIEGYSENRANIANVYEPGRVDVLKKRVWSINEGTVVVYAPKMPYRCAPAPSETTLLIHTVLKHRGVREKVRLVHIDANDKPQPPVIADIVKSLFESAGIELITSREIAEIGADYIVLSDGEKIEYNILAMLEPNRAPQFVAEAGLGDKWFEVRSPTDLRSVKYDDIYGVGDVAKLPFPKNQEIAYESALFAANKILDETGTGEPVKVQYAFLGWAYVGNLEGRLESLSVRFGLNFTTKPPKPTKDPEPRAEYTKAKDSWEQAYLRNLFLY
ncbi:MAG: NAD(P)/FAD-dependent oxidoreductase [Desulfurococcales archaeon]|nr:NAD(P)/FAD-dependent oxidoreductase [Desulfurococcales archaeon]